MPKTTEFVSLYTRHERELYRYTLSLCPNEEEARDILQDSSVALWDKFDQYNPDRPFTAWAFGFIKLQVRKHRGLQRQQSKCFDDDILDSLTELRQEQMAVLEARKTALKNCLKKLSVKQLNLLKLRYEDNVNFTEICKSMNKKRDALYKTLERTRKLLHECISKSVRGLL